MLIVFWGLIYGHWSQMRVMRVRFISRHFSLSKLFEFVLWHSSITLTYMHIRSISKTRSNWSIDAITSAKVLKASAYWLTDCADWLCCLTVLPDSAVCADWLCWLTDWLTVLNDCADFADWLCFEYCSNVALVCPD